MAIADSRIALKNITTNTKSTFIDAVDKSKDTVSSTSPNKALSASISSKLNKKAVSAGMNGFTNKTPNRAIDINNKLGMFNTSLDTSCDIFKGDYSYDFRDFNLGFGIDGFNIDFGCSSTISKTLNNILNAKNDIVKSISSLKDKTLSNIETSVSNVIDDIQKELDVSTSFINSINTAGNIVNSLGVIGMSLSSKNLIKDLSILCNSSTSSLSDELLAVLNKFLLEAALSIGNCLDPKNTLLLASNLISAGIATPTEIITGFTKNFKSNEDTHIVPKMHVLVTLVKDTGDTSSPDTLVSTKSYVDTILKSLDNSGNSSEGPATDYYITIDTLNTLNSDWDKDNDGNINYNKVKGNNYMKKLASSSLTTTNPSSDELTISPTISDEKRRSIGIIASCSNCVNKHI